MFIKLTSENKERFTIHECNWVERDGVKVMWECPKTGDVNSCVLDSGRDGEMDTSSSIPQEVYAEAWVMNDNGQTIDRLRP